MQERQWQRSKPGLITFFPSSERARLVAAEVHGEQVMDPVSQIRLIRTTGSPFAGETLTDLRRNTERDWTVVGTVRDSTVHTGEDITIHADDEVVVAGSDDAIQEFEQTIDRHG